MSTATYKNINKFAVEILKLTRPGKTYVEEALRIEIFMNKNIKDNYNLKPKTSLVDYANMLLPTEKKCRVKIEYCPLITRHSRKI